MVSLHPKHSQALLSKSLDNVIALTEKP